MIGVDLTIEPYHRDLGRRLCTVLVEMFGLAELVRPVIGVGGESGSGKSITATCLGYALEEQGRRPVLLHLDDYFRLPPRETHKARVRDLANVGPREVRMDRLAADVAAFRRGEIVTDAPLVDYAGNCIGTHSLDFTENDVLIVEGTYALALPDLDLRVFMARTYAETRAQRHARRRDAHDLDPFIEEVLAIEHGIVRLHAAEADVLIDRDYRVSFSGHPFSGIRA